MSYLESATAYLRDRGHPSTGHGFGQAPDPFAGLSQGNGDVEGPDDGIDFEDTYDGLGDQLDEANDDFNDDTFGGGSGNVAKPVGKDFDFFGKTAEVSEALSEEHMRFSRQQVATKPVAAAAPVHTPRTEKPTRSGYEKYQETEMVPDLKIDPSLWGSQAQVPQSQAAPFATPAATQPGAGAPGRKMLSLEEVEAQMRAQSRKPAPHSAQQPAQSPVQPQSVSQQAFLQQVAQAGLMPALPEASKPAHQSWSNVHRQDPSVELDSRAHAPPRPMSGQQVPLPGWEGYYSPSPQPRQPLQEFQKQFQPQQFVGMVPAHGEGRMGHHNRHQSKPSGGQHGYPSYQPMPHPQHFASLSEAEKEAFLIEDAKRAKRNHKIRVLSRYNGLMTPSDKNFVTRIQLQQLMTATGNVNDEDPDVALVEDFYYQVHNQIHGGPRQNPNQPLNHFAQTYLHQTSGRYGLLNRRHNRGDTHIQRMEQQVQRAVEAAKLRPKSKQLVVEGSLGKISFSNSKTPKPLLNIKRAEGAEHKRSHSATRGGSSGKDHSELSSTDQKSVLRNIEAIYTSLMKVEDEMRKEPPLPMAESETEAIERHEEWRQRIEGLSQQLWEDLKVLSPVDAGLEALHPFIAILSFPKGKKAIPRVFRHLSQEQRVTMLTLIVLYLDVLDVIRLGQLQPGETQLPTAAREAVDLFSAVVTPSLFSYVSEAPLFNVIGLMGLILDRVNIPRLAQTRVGLSILTMLTSRATLVRDGSGAGGAGGAMTTTNDSEWQQWSHSYNKLFDILEPLFGSIFPASVSTGEDMYVWQFLAAMGSGANTEQQQRLVIAVKDRVMATVTQSKTLPPEMGSMRLGNVNRFMHAIGLDVELLG